MLLMHNKAGSYYAMALSEAGIVVTGGIMKNIVAIDICDDIIDPTTFKTVNHPSLKLHNVPNPKDNERLSAAILHELHTRLLGQSITWDVVMQDNQRTFVQVRTFEGLNINSHLRDNFST